MVPSDTWAFSLFIKILLFVLARPAEGTGTVFSIVYDEEVGTNRGDWNHTFFGTKRLKCFNSCVCQRWRRSQLLFDPNFGGGTFSL